MFNLLRVAFAGAIFLPIVFADNMFAGCYSKNPGGTAAPATGPATRDSSDLCNVSPTLSRRQSILVQVGELTLITGRLLQYPHPFVLPSRYQAMSL